MNEHESTEPKIRRKRAGLNMIGLQAEDPATQESKSLTTKAADERL